MRTDKPSVDGLMALLREIEIPSADMVALAGTPAFYDARARRDEGRKAIRAYASRLAQPQGEPPFDAFRDLAGRLGWDTEQEHAGGMFCDADLQATWDQLTRAATAPPQPQAQPALSERAAFDFTIDNGVIRWKAGGCQTATDAEIAMWNALASAPQADRELLRQAGEALEAAQRDGGPDAFYASTDELMDRAITAIRARLGEGEKT
jgi:hypothetical protein